MSRTSEDLKPRNGQKLVVGVVARISDCQNQKEMSLDDQLDHAREVVTEKYHGLVDYRVIATKGKGERLDRPELVEIERMLRTGEIDILIQEDVGRLVRGADAVRLWGIAKDHGTRCLAPNDCCDTDEDNWEQDVLNACAEHVGHNAHTSKRIKHKKMNRFIKFGGATACEIYGYIKPEGAKTYDDWQKDPTATPKIQEGLLRLRATLNCTAVADWFNKEGVPVGNYCSGDEWTGAMVRRYFGNSLLKGMPYRGKLHTVKHYESGRRISVLNPKGPVYRECPHLAHVDPDEFDDVNALLDKKNYNYRHKLVNGVDPRRRVPRKRTRFPGQLALCWYCGRNYVWGGNGIADNLMCNGSRGRHCWNSIGCNGPLVIKKIKEAITAELYKLNGFDGQFIELVRHANQNRSGGEVERRQKLLIDEATLSQEKENLSAAIAQYGPRPMVLEMLQRLENREKELARERYQLELINHRELQLPQSTEELRQMLEDKFQQLALDSPEFGDMLKLLIPEFYIYLVRLVDGGHPQPRAKIKLNLLGIVPDAQHVPGLE
jgi:site-specific DNA recombinase